MKKEFIPYKQALALKELGFKKECLASYWRKKLELVNSVGLLINKDGINDPIAAPSYQQAFRWFRKKHYLTHVIERDGGWWLVKLLDYANERDDVPTEINFDFRVKDDSYEEAELACLKKLIEIVKKP